MNNIHAKNLNTVLKCDLNINFMTACSNSVRDKHWKTNTHTSAIPNYSQSNNYKSFFIPGH